MQQKELFTRCSKNPIITVNDIPYKSNSVFNAACTIVKDKTILLMRVEDRRGMSHLTVARSDNGFDNWRIESKPALEACPDKFPEEQWGIEDPRITFLQDSKKWAITYVAYSESAPLVSLALTEDFKSFERIGAVLPPENKDAALFPVKFDNRWAMLHRPVPFRKGSKFNIWISYSPDLKHWGSHRLLLCARDGGWWDSGKIGLCAQPIFTEHGWLILYHGVRETASGSIYRLGLALLDKENPEEVIRRSDEWIFSPREKYERTGDVENVTFSCGWLEQKGEIRIYYGAADTSLCLATANMTEIINFLLYKGKV